MRPIAEWVDPLGYAWYICPIAEGPQNNSSFCIFRDTVAWDQNAEAQAVRYFQIYDEVWEYWRLLKNGTIPPDPLWLTSWPYHKDFEVKDVLLRGGKRPRRRRPAWQVR